jgi:hypothetical protein
MNRGLAEELYRISTSNLDYIKKIDLLEKKLDTFETDSYNEGVMQFTSTPRFLRED